MARLTDKSMRVPDKAKSRPEIEKSPANWKLNPPFGYKSVFVFILIAFLMVLSGRNTEIDRMFSLFSEAIGHFAGFNESSQIVNASKKITTSMFPVRISEVTEVARIENFDPDSLPFFSTIKTEEVVNTVVDPKTLEIKTVKSSRVVLYQPVGYLKHVALKMLETIEIALWATFFSIIISTPLAYFAAANYTSNRLVYGLARGTISLFRSVPEIISAMFLVLAFGFGPIAGILALGIHSSGFLGKFYAEDIENADIGPQEALKAIGVSKLKILRYAVLPQVLPQYVAYNLYILDRNVRMATVVGIVGAGGIGQELRGRYDMFDYDHVATILILIFVTVFILDQVASAIRSKLIGSGK